jgi:hypothetical protein
MAFNSEHINENLKKICEGEIWMPLASSLNDPFEFQMVRDSLPSEKKMEFRRDTLARNSILSFCPELNNNLLWSHYADGHRGMCMEFEISHKDLYFPVIYLQKQEDMTENILRWLDIKKDVITKESMDWTIEEQVVISKLQKIMLCKKADWRYEKEIRIICRDLESDNDDILWREHKGYWGKQRHLNLRLQRVILGFNCTLQNKAKVIEIVNKTNERCIMTEMQEMDFKYSREKTIEVLAENNRFIKVAQMKRRGDSLTISPADLIAGKDKVIYDF